MSSSENGRPLNPTKRRSPLGERVHIEEVIGGGGPVSLPDLADVADTLTPAKGSILAGTGSVYDEFPAGPNGHVIVYDSSYPMGLKTVPFGSVAGTFNADCLAGDAVGNAVYITGDKVLGQYQVATVDPRDLLKIPAVGVIESKPSSTTCVVRYLGPLASSGRTPQKQQWVGLLGSLVEDKTTVTPLPGGKVLIQQMGVALASDIILIQPQMPIIDAY